MKHKNLIFVLFTVLLSCQGNDENDSNPDLGLNPLLTQVVINYPDNSMFSKFYRYKNINQIQEIINSDGTTELYTYTNDLITGIEYLFEDPAFRDEVFYTYDKQKRLTQEVHLYHHNSSGMRTVFTHNGNGTVSYIRYLGNLTQQTDQVFKGIYMLGANGEILQHIETNVETDEKRLFSYAYDNKDSAYKNILDGSVGFEYILNGPHNMLSMSMEDNGGNIIYSYTSTFSFNRDKYPEIEFRTSQTGITEIFYNYK